MEKTKLDEKGYPIFKDSNILVHKWVAQKKYNMSYEELRKYEIHHIDGDKTNNYPENLVILRREDHYSIEKHNRHLRNLIISFIGVCFAALFLNILQISDAENRMLYFILELAILVLGVFLITIPQYKLRTWLFNRKILEKGKGNNPLKPQQPNL